MQYEVACTNGRVYATFTSLEVLDKFIRVIEDLIQSEIFNNHYEEAKELIDFLLDLKASRKKLMKEE